jgi:hypothetical protein
MPTGPTSRRWVPTQHGRRRTTYALMNLAADDPAFATSYPWNGEASFEPAPGAEPGAAIEPEPAPIKNMARTTTAGARAPKTKRGATK